MFANIGLGQIDLIALHVIQFEATQYFRKSLIQRFSLVLNIANIILNCTIGIYFGL